MLVVTKFNKNIDAVLPIVLLSSKCPLERYTHASMLINMNVNIYELQNRLGHERVHTTIDKYCHLYPDKQAEIADKLDKIWNEENESGGNANV